MAKIIEFPSSSEDPKKQDGGTEKSNIDLLRELYERREKLGQTFRVNWRLMLEAQKILPTLRQASKQRELRVVSLTEPHKMSDEELINLFNNSSQAEWSKNPSFWIAVYTNINERKLVTPK